MKLAYKLKHRIQIKKAIQTPNAEGGFDRDYETLTTIWAAIKNSSLSRSLKYIRGEALSEGGSGSKDLPTHICTIRKVAIENFGKRMTKGFSVGFDSIEDLMPLKSDYFIFLQKGSTVKGRLFEILRILRDENNDEYIKFEIREREEQGTGWPE
jgi:hypothetical protein